MTLITHSDGARRRHLLVATPEDGVVRTRLAGFDRLREKGWQVSTAPSEVHAWQACSNGSSPTIALVRLALPRNTVGSWQDREIVPKRTLSLVEHLVYTHVTVIPWMPEVARGLPISSSLALILECLTGQTAFSSLPGACMFYLLEATFESLGQTSS